jgi:mRNA interferase MazF
MADLGFAAKFRPVVIVSRHDPDPPRALAIYVPITSQNRASRYEVKPPKLRFLHQKDSVANVQGIAALPTVEIKRALAWTLDLED